MSARISRASRNSAISSGPIITRATKLTAKALRVGLSYRFGQ
jgi:hypothetical protein